MLRNRWGYLFRSVIFLWYRKLRFLYHKTLRGMHTMCRGRLQKQPHIGAQSVHRPSRLRGRGVEVGLPTLFFQSIWEKDPVDIFVAPVTALFTIWKRFNIFFQLLWRNIFFQHIEQLPPVIRMGICHHLPHPVFDAVDRKVMLHSDLFVSLVVHQTKKNCVITDITSC